MSTKPPEVSVSPTMCHQRQKLHKNSFQAHNRKESNKSHIIYMLFPFHDCYYVYLITVRIWFGGTPCKIIDYYCMQTRFIIIICHDISLYRCNYTRVKHTVTNISSHERGVCAGILMYFANRRHHQNHTSY